mgnify:CR=1 FL=1
MVKIGVKRLIREEINGSVNCNPEKPVQIAAKIMEAIKKSIKPKTIKGNPMLKEVFKLSRFGFKICIIIISTLIIDI